MKKTYVNAMLQVVSIKNNDILTSSPMEYRGDINGNVIIAAPGQRSFDSWYEGF